MAGLAATTMVAGCDDPIRKNSTLVLRNEVSEPVQLGIQVERYNLSDPSESKTTFEDIVAIPVEDRKELDILGNDTFRITANGLGQEITFRTKPICNYAHTKVIVTDAREITKDVKSCE
jgi:hypothetical protein